MDVSVELLSTVSATVAAVLSVLGASWAMYRSSEKRADARFDRLEAQFDKVDARFDKVDARFDKVDARFEKIEGEIAELRDDVTDVKISIARLEGPRSRFELGTSR